MSTYTLHMDCQHWQEQLTFRNRDTLLDFLHSGWVPEGCRLEVEHDGERKEWDRAAAYAKNYNKKGRTPQLNRLLKQQAQCAEHMKEWLANRPKVVG